MPKRGALKTANLSDQIRLGIPNLKFNTLTLRSTLKILVNPGDAKNPHVLLFILVNNVIRKPTCFVVIADA